MYGNQTLSCAHILGASAANGADNAKKVMHEELELYISWTCQLGLLTNAAMKHMTKSWTLETPAVTPPLSSRSLNNCTPQCYADDQEASTGIARLRQHKEEEEEEQGEEGG